MTERRRLRVDVPEFGTSRIAVDSRESYRGRDRPS